MKKQVSIFNFPPIFKKLHSQLRKEMFNYPQCLALSITSQFINQDQATLMVLNWNWCQSFITSDFLPSLHPRTVQMWQFSHRMWHRMHFFLLCPPEHMYNIQIYHVFLLVVCNPQISGSMVLAQQVTYKDWGMKEGNYFLAILIWI